MNETLADVYRANIEDADRLLELLKDSDIETRQRVLMQKMENVEKLKALESQN